MKKTDRVYYYYGKIMYLFQMIEYNLKTLIPYEELLNLFDEDEVNKDDLEDRISSSNCLYFELSDATFGHLLNQKQLRNLFEPKEIDYFKSVKELRDYYAHKFYFNYPYETKIKTDSSKLIDKIIKDFYFCRDMNDLLIRALNVEKETYKSFRI